MRRYHFPLESQYLLHSSRCGGGASFGPELCRLSAVRKVSLLQMAELFQLWHCSERKPHPLLLD